MYKVTLLCVFLSCFFSACQSKSQQKEQENQLQNELDLDGQPHVEEKFHFGPNPGGT